MKSKSEEAQLAILLAKFDPRIAEVVQTARKKLRGCMTGAVEIVATKPGALRISLSPTEDSADAILSIVAYSGWVNLFFHNWRKLADPQKLLRGSGKQVRNILLVNDAVLDRPAVQALVTEAVRAASKPFDAAKGELIVPAEKASHRFGWRSDVWESGPVFRRR